MFIKRPNLNRSWPWTAAPSRLAVAVCGACLAAALASSSLAAPLVLDIKIALPGVEGRFDHFACDPAGRRLFVAALGNGSLEVLDIGEGRALHRISHLKKPTGVAFIPKENWIAVSNGDDGTLRFYDAATYQLVKTLSGVDDADNLRYDPAADLLYLGYGSGHIAVISATGSIIHRIPVPGHPESFQLDRGSPRIFVNIPDSTEISVLDRQSNAAAAHWPLKTFRGNFPMALDGEGRRILAGCRTPPQLLVLDATTGRAIENLAIASDTDDLFWDARRKRAYVSCGGGEVDVIAIPEGSGTARMLDRVHTAPGARTSYYSAELDRFYLAVPHRGGSQPAGIWIYRPAD